MKNNKDRIIRRLENGWIPNFKTEITPLLKECIIITHNDTYQHFLNIKKSENDAFYYTLWLLRKKLQQVNYNVMPKERKDNQNIVTGGINYSKHNGSNINRIRVPSKKRKNKFKNFLKLFPNYDGNG